MQCCECSMERKVPNGGRLELKNMGEATRSGVQRRGQHKTRRTEQRIMSQCKCRQPEGMVQGRTMRSAAGTTPQTVCTQFSGHHRHAQTRVPATQRPNPLAQKTEPTRTPLRL